MSIRYPRVALHSIRASCSDDEDALAADNAAREAAEQEEDDSDDQELADHMLRPHRLSHFFQGFRDYLVLRNNSF